MPDPAKYIIESAEITNARGERDYFVQAPAAHEIYNLVGRVASEWANLEHVLDRIIWRLAGLQPKTGACLTAQMMGVWPRQNTIVALLTTLPEDNPKLAKLTDFIKPTNKLSGKCRDLSDQRNRIVHDPWYANSTGEVTAQLRSMPKNDLIYALLDHDKKEILETLGKIEKMSSNFDEIRRKIFRLMPKA